MWSVCLSVVQSVCTVMYCSKCLAWSPNCSTVARYWVHDLTLSKICWHFICPRHRVPFVSLLAGLDECILFVLSCLTPMELKVQRFRPRSECASFYMTCIWRFLDLIFKWKCLSIFSDGSGGHTGGLCELGQKTQDSRTGSQRPRHHHRHQSEGAETHTCTSQGSYALWKCMDLTGLVWKKEKWV